MAVLSVPALLTAIVALATLYLFAPTVSPARAAYYPSGPQTFVDQSQLDGWVRCFSGPYNSTVSLDAALTFCSQGDRLLLAGGPTFSSTLTVLAAAPRADVLFDTGTSNDPHNANGSGWYFSPSYSWGFAKQGDQIERDPCDTVATDVPGPNPAQRLCWPTSGGSLSPGGRAGATFDISDASYSRYVYVAVPFATAAPSTVDFGKLQAGTVSLPRSVTVTNSGFLDAKVYDAQILEGAADPGEFTLDRSGCLTTLSPGEACQMWVRFAPLAVSADDPCRSNLWAFPEACDRGPGTTLSIAGSMGELRVALRGTGALPPSGQQAAAVENCKKRAKKKDWTKRHLTKCKKKARHLPA
jgi:hypothetical protein